jgi:hypothetical protein
MTLDQLSDHVDDEVPVVTAFNVGQGDSYLISLPAGKDGKGNMTHGFVLIDAGASGTEGMVAGGGCRHAAPDACVDALRCRPRGRSGDRRRAIQDAEKLTAKSYFWGDKVT